MKYITFILLSVFIISTSCRGKKTESKKTIVESKEEIKNEFGNEDSLLKYQTPSVIPQTKRDSLKMIPVEADGGIGDGAVPLDTLIKYQTPPIISKEKRDSLIKKTKDH